jgi:hypothetical protein
MQAQELRKLECCTQLMETLEFQIDTRKGGHSRHEVIFYDFVISGQRFGDIINLETLDKVSPFSDTLRLSDKLWHIDSLTFKVESTLTSGRTILYVCPECGDLECGVVSMKMEATEETIIWKDFGIETNLEGLVEAWELLDIEFDKKAYLTSFENLEILLRTT